MSLIQFILVVFFLFALVKVLLRFKHLEINFGTALIWVIFWIIGIAVVLYPNSTASLAKFVGVGRGADLVVYLSLAIIFYIIGKLLVGYTKMQQEITKLTRHIAIKEAREEHEIKL